MRPGLSPRSSGEPGSPATRGAISATLGSLKCGRSGINQDPMPTSPSRSTSASTNASRAVVASGRPALRAAPGPLLLSSRIVAPAIGGVEESSTTTRPSVDAIPPSCGVITVTSSTVNTLVAPGWLSGWIAPASTRRSISVDEATSAPRSICSAIRAPGAVSRKILSGDPATTTGPVRSQVPSMAKCISARVFGIR